MIISFNINHLEMIKEVFKEDSQEVDLFVNGIEIFSPYSREVSYRLNISIKQVSDTDEILDFKLGNIKENSALAKKINKSAYANVSRLSDDLKEKIILNCTSIRYVEGSLFVTEEQGNKLMKKAIESFGQLLKMNKVDSLEYNKLYGNASFIMENKNSFTDLTDVTIGKQSIKNGLQFLYQDFKSDFNKNNISLMLLAMFSNWGYHTKYNLAYKEDNAYLSKAYINIFIENMKANKDKISPFFNGQKDNDTSEFIENVYSQLYIDFIKVSSKALEQKDVGDVFKNEVFIIFSKIIEKAVNSLNFYKTFNNKGFQYELNNIFEMLEDNQDLLFKGNQEYKKITSFFIDNKLLENKEITLEHVEDDIFIENDAPYQDTFIFSSQKFFELIPKSFIQADNVFSHDPFHVKNSNYYSNKNELASFYLKVMSSLKDVFELATNVNVNDYAMSENNLVMVLSSNEEIDKKKLKNLFFDMIKVFNKYDTISNYLENHEMEMQKLVMKNDSKDLWEKNIHKKKSVVKF